MKSNKSTAPSFPMETFLQVQQEMLEAQRKLKKEKAVWAGVRNSIPEARQHELDEQFRITFESIGSLMLSAAPKELSEIKRSLKTLVDQGASACLLGDNELGSYNMAMLIDNIAFLTDPAELDNVAEIIRLTIVAGANLATQKTYVGNGGAISIEYLSHYLGIGLSSEYKLKYRQQYECCYKIFPWVVSAPVERSNPFNEFLATLKVSPEVEDLQEKVLLAMMGFEFIPYRHNEEQQYDRFFTHMFSPGDKWIALLFPYEEQALMPYINAFRPNITADLARKVINAFTSNNKSRKYFKTYFSLRPHWLLQSIVERAPELVFDLVKRNEQDMLAPFLKNCKPAILELKDVKGNSLLHQAVISRGHIEHTIQLLRNAGFSLQSVNGEGLTPLALARKYNRTEVMKWLN